MPGDRALSGVSERNQHGVISKQPLAKWAGSTDLRLLMLQGALKCIGMGLQPQESHLWAGRNRGDFRENGRRA